MTKEQDEYIKDHWNDGSCESLRKQFNSVFGTSYKTTAFHYHTKRLGLSKHIEHHYTSEQDDFLRENSGIMSRQELTDSFNAKYGTHIKLNAINQRCSLKGWRASTDGKFKDGGVPWIKTLGGREAYIKTLKGGNSTSFKKGMTPYNTLPVGTVKLWGHELKIKTDSGWENRLRYIWKLSKGNIPDKNVVISVDGNKWTNSISNLRVISNKTLTMLMSNNWIGKGMEIVDAGIAWCNLREVLYETSSSPRLHAL